MQNEKTTVSVQPGQTLRKSRFNGMENVLQEFQLNVQRGKTDSLWPHRGKGNNDMDPRSRGSTERGVEMPFCVKGLTCPLCGCLEI